MKTMQVATIALLVGSAIGFGANHFLTPNGSMSHDTMSTDSSMVSDSNEPLYWVAPMDPNYQRDKPGKSPMGMDLIPVYADDLAGDDDKPGTIRIDASVENNLGVKTAQVSLEKLSPRIETVGYIAFDESRLWQTNVRVAGWVEKLYINAVGEKVKKGEVLFTLYSPELVKAQEELLNAYRTQRKGLINGATERLVTLGVDRAQIKQIVKRGKASQTIDIKAIDNGVIASLNIREGGYLSPSQAVISAGPLDEVWVDAEVFERQAHWIESGSSASMTLDAVPGQTWQGKVDYVYPILDPKTRTIRMRLKFANPNGALKPNMFANIALQPVTDEFALTIPKSSVIRSGGMSRVVLSEGDGRYRSARIEIGREAANHVEVLQGLTEQDTVVTSAHFMLDSESSQSADLSRINGVEPEAESVWAQGQITDLMKGHRMATINHKPVPEWDWPGMVMNFNFSEDVDLAELENGQVIDFEMVQMSSGQYEIVDFKIDTAKALSEVWVTGEVSMVMPDFGMVTLQHSPVTEWEWQAGEINFSVSEELDLSQFVEGQKVRFLVAKEGSDFALRELQAEGAEQ
ncbi:HlyD family efflux transporter periplasmic adaptor subunit [Vibrio sp. T187]|uniref:efflux RND transporter periplasmic adaptor subunit n=1 Tax=Vibrio TaxID=662 RepID=UPI0010C94B96|nr:MULTISPECIES: efflux RND transporter periplasmic adaptor subunit [Vibrio]MBW3695789.1 HlyD family efflux transporter periplasmic adaptor subunit [Vibrio sp. T187]